MILEGEKVGAKSFNKIRNESGAENGQPLHPVFSLSLTLQLKVRKPGSLG